jgi:hypothetical protein
METKIVIREKKVEIQARFPKSSLPPEKPDQSNETIIKKLMPALVALATAVLGLVILLISRDAPEWGRVLRELLDLAF